MVFGQRLYEALLNAFYAHLVAEVGPYVELHGWHVMNLRELGSYFKTAEQLAEMPDCYVIEVVTKTMRAPSGYDDCCGTESPSPAAMAAAERVAESCGLELRWEAVEKGYGTFVFSHPDARAAWVEVNNRHHAEMRAARRAS